MKLGESVFLLYLWNPSLSCGFCNFIEVKHWPITTESHLWKRNHISTTLICKPENCTKLKLDWGFHFRQLSFTWLLSCRGSSSSGYHFTPAFPGHTSCTFSHCAQRWCVACACLWVCLCRCRVKTHTSRTVAFWHNKDFRLLLAGILAQETLILVVLIVGATHWNIIIVALQREERKKKRQDDRRDGHTKTGLCQCLKTLFFTVTNRVDDYNTSIVWLKSPA